MPRTEPRYQSVTEAAFLAQVLELAKLYGWRTAHFRPARTTAGWRTPCQGDAKGFPDLVLVKGKRLIFAELKAEGRDLSPEQSQWIEALTLVRCDLYIWRPSEWEEIVRTLSA